MEKANAAMDDCMPHSRNVCVAVRFRPLSPKEKANEFPTSSAASKSSSSIASADRGRANSIQSLKENGTVSANSLWTLNYQNVPSVIDNMKGNSYIYDHVFDETVTNLQVFNGIARDIVHSSIKGVNGTIFAYGQTSSGKTYTMLGSDEMNEPGIISRSVSEIFNLIKARKNTNFTIKLSFLEVYNEKLIDLIAMAQSPIAASTKEITIQENSNGFLELRNLDVKIVVSAEEIFKVVKAGEKVRHSTSTELNERSSRSHSILRLRIEAKTPNEEGKFGCSPHSMRVGVLNLVDLAGSEGVSKAQTEGERRCEGGNINRSLLALSQVISQLSEQAEGKSKGIRSFINFRDSKLTRLLSDSLGGNSQTAIICNCSPARVNYRETCSTLEFAHRAKAIRNKVKVNILWSDEYFAMLKSKGNDKKARMFLSSTPRATQGQASLHEKLKALETENDMLKDNRKVLEEKVTVLEDQLAAIDCAASSKTAEIDSVTNSSHINETIATQLSEYKLKYRYSYGSSLRDMNFRDNLTGLDTAEQNKLLTSSYSSFLASLNRCPKCADRFREMTALRLDNSYLQVKIEQLEYIVNSSPSHSGARNSNNNKPFNRPAHTSTLFSNQLRREIRQSVIASDQLPQDEVEGTLSPTKDVIEEETMKLLDEQMKTSMNDEALDKLRAELSEMKKSNDALKAALEKSESRATCLQQMMDDEMENRMNYEIKCNSLEEERVRLLKSIQEMEAENMDKRMLEAKIFVSIDSQTDETANTLSAYDAAFESQKFKLKEKEAAFTAIEESYYKLSKEFEIYKETAYNEQQDTAEQLLDTQNENQSLIEKVQQAENWLNSLKKENKRLQQFEEEREMVESAKLENEQKFQLERQAFLNEQEEVKELLFKSESSVLSLSNELAAQKDKYMQKMYEYEQVKVQLDEEVMQRVDRDEKVLVAEQLLLKLKDELHVHKEAAIQAENRSSIAEIQFSSLRDAAEQSEQRWVEAAQCLNEREMEASSLIAALMLEKNEAVQRLTGTELELKGLRRQFNILERYTNQFDDDLLELQELVPFTQTMAELLIDNLRTSTDELKPFEDGADFYMDEILEWKDTVVGEFYEMSDKFTQLESNLFEFTTGEEQRLTDLILTLLSCYTNSINRSYRMKEDLERLQRESESVSSKLHNWEEVMKKKEVEEACLKEENEMLKTTNNVLKEELHSYSQFEIPITSDKDSTSGDAVDATLIATDTTQWMKNIKTFNTENLEKYQNEEQHVEYSNDVKRLRNRVADQEALIQSLHESNKEMDDLNAALLDERKVTNSQIDKLMDELIANKEMNNELQLSKESVESTVTTWEVKCKRIESEIESQNTQIKILESRCLTYEEEIKNLKQLLASKANTLNSSTPELLQMQIEQLQQTHNATQQELVRARHQIEDLLHQIKNNESFNDYTKDMHSKVKYQTSAMQDMEKAIQQLTEEKAAAERQLKISKIMRNPRICMNEISQDEENSSYLPTESIEEYTTSNENTATSLQTPEAIECYRNESMKDTERMHEAKKMKLMQSNMPNEEIGTPANKDEESADCRVQ